MRRETEDAILRVAEALAWRRWIGPGSSIVFLLAYALIPVAAAASIAFVGCLAEVVLYARVLVRTVGGGPTQAQLRRAGLWSLGAWGALALASVDAAPSGADRLLLMLGATVVLLAQRRHRGRFGRAALASLRAQEASVLTVARGVLGVRELTAREVEAGERDDLAVRAYPDGAMVVSIPAHVLLVHADEPKVADRFEAAGWELDRIEYDDRLMWLRRPAWVEPVPDAAPWDGRLPQDRTWLLVGVGEDGRRIGWDLKQAPHALFTGATGVGKTTSILLVVVQAAHVGFRVWALDPKESEFGLLGDRVERLAFGLDDCWQALIDAEAEMRERQALLRERGKRHWSEVEGLRPIMVVVDEAFDLLGAGVRDKERKALRDAAADSLGSIARLGRAPGVHLLAAAQRPDAKVLAGELRNNLRCRLLLGRPLKSEVLMTLDGVDEDGVPNVGADPLPKGRGLMQEASPSAPRIVQCVYATDEQVESALDDLRPAPAAVPERWQGPAPVGRDSGIELSLEDGLELSDG